MKLRKNINARLVELVDTSDLKSDSSIKSIGSSPITSKIFVKKNYFAKMMELVDMLGLGSSSSKGVGVRVPFLVNKILLICLLIINF